MACCTAPRARRRLLLLCAVLLGPAALAQERGFRLHRDDGTTAGSAHFLVERPWYSTQRAWAVGLSVDYAFQPLVLQPPDGGDAVPLVANALLGRVELAGALFDRVQVGATLPVTLLETGTAEPLTQAGPAQQPQLGDPRVGVMVRLLGQAESSPVSLHLGGDVWIPVGASSTLQGDRSVRLRARAVLAGAVGRARWTFDAAFLARPYASIGPPQLGLTAASEAQAGAALGFALAGGRVLLGPEVRFATQVVGDQAFQPEGMSLEVLAGAQWWIAGLVQLGVAAGAGLLPGAGTPDARASLRLAWAPRRDLAAPVPALADACPDGTSRDASGGCTGAPGPAPPPGDDADADGVADARDRCPFEPETRNGVRDDDGCPEYALEPGTALAQVLAPQPGGAPSPAATTTAPGTPPTASSGAAATGSSAAPTTGGALPPSGSGAPATAGALEALAALRDADRDGVPDAADRCPVTPEDLDAFEDEDGCPEPDNDGDGAPDSTDACPMEAEVFNGVTDDDGCPDTAPDGDRDGVADALDRCPLEPESPNGLRDDDGCPEFEQPRSQALARLLTAPVAPVAPLAASPAAAAAPLAQVPADSDADGVDDTADRCPLSAEDVDAFEDEDGCPEPDNDADGVLDAKDRCPDAAEVVNGSRDDDGCPDEVEDADGDGVPWDLDRCPLEPAATVDGCPRSAPPALAIAGFVATPAWPGVSPPAPVSAPAPAEADLDGDSVPDAIDPCPMSREDPDSFEDEDGCPEADNDHDGIADALDRCPLEAETINGNQDTDGCPDRGAGAVRFTGHQVVIDGIIQFTPGSANLQARSLPLLKQVASTLLAAPSVAVEIQGHTDDVGSAATNVKLSARRAEAIRKVLVKYGVNPQQLRAKGFGPTRPRATNKTAAGREANRRVEFQILGEAT